MTTTAGLDPARLHQLTMGFFASRAVQAAVELDLFTELAAAAGTAAEVERRCGLHPRSSRDFLDALVALDLLDRDDEDRYQPTPSTRMFLDRNSPAYLGGLAEMAGTVLYGVWGNLTEALRTGKPQGAAGAVFLDGMYQDPVTARKFMAAMDTVSTRVAVELAAALRLSEAPEPTTVVDVGGARGNLLGVLLSANPTLRGVCLDLPAVERLYDEHIPRFGLGDRIRFAAVDFERAPLPAGDVLVLGHVLHGASPDDRAMLLGKAHAALPAGGRVAIYDRMIADDRRGSALSLLGSLNMLLTTPDGAEYTVADCRELLVRHGFDDVTSQPIAGTETLVIATRR
ncbi:methyltransferase [Actinokineospora enzanensis]|uniref:methyltransferase n=1 Tax=Actinokineospora enzanensis TaxID=155975 RepID=UPI0003773745|nr:methyltransferase [Actinokineospora enzanensis]